MFFFRNHCEGAHSTVVASPFVFRRSFCCVIAEFAPNVTDMSNPDYFTHNAIVLTGSCSVVRERAMHLLYRPCVFEEDLFPPCCVHLHNLVK